MVAAETPIMADTRVLVVEDLPSDAELCQREVAKVLGACEFLRVETRDEFLAALDEFLPELIVSDFMLPAFDGLTALKLAIAHSPDVPFIILTGSMNEDTAVECMRAGAWDYVIKEHVKRLGGAVIGVLEQQRLRRERLVADAALRDSERLLKEAQRLGRIGHWEREPASGQIVWSDMVYAIYGRDPALGPPTSDEEAAYYAAADSARLRELATRALTTGDAYEIDLQLQLVDGRTVDVVSTGSAVRDADGRVVRLLGTVQDVSGRKRAERALQDSERLNATILSTIPFPMVAVDQEGHILFQNERLRLLVGDPPVDALCWTVYRDDQQQCEECPLRQEIRLGETGAIEISGVFGGRMVENFHSGMLFHGTPALLEISIDITERKRQEAEHKSLEAQFRASQHVEAIGGLAGGVAHDFNNLLTVIQGNTAFALDRTPEDDPLRGDLMEVMGAAERAAALTRQLLAFSRKQVLQPVLLDLNQATDAIGGMLRRIIGEDVDLVWRLAPNLGVVLADPAQIDQVLMNLAVNARDAMPSGGKLTLETANVELDDAYVARHPSAQPGPYVMLAVSDTGCGMDAETQARMFEPFFTTKEKGRGTGLGLSTVYGIVKQSGGNIWVYSELDRGTTFKIYLPRVMTATAAYRPVAVAPTLAGGTETILIVEDDEAVRGLAGRILRGAGYSVLAATGGDEALNIARQHEGEIHLALTDVVMPGMSGRVFAERLATVRPGVPVLYMSGYTDNAIVHHGKLDPGTAFVGKPFTAAGLVQAVRETLDHDSPPEDAGTG